MPRPISERPEIRPKRPAPDRRKPLKSKRGTSTSRRLAMNLSDRATPSTPIGTLTQKIQRQLKYVVMNPPSGGPATGPSSAGTVRYASASTRSLFSTLRKSTRRPTGTIIAPPRPWKTRAAIRVSSEFDAPQQIEPRVKTTMAEQKTVRAPNRSATQPDAGMNRAVATMRAVSRAGRMESRVLLAPRPGHRKVEMGSCGHNGLKAPSVEADSGRLVRAARPVTTIPTRRHCGVVQMLLPLSFRGDCGGVPEFPAAARSRNDQFEGNSDMNIKSLALALALAQAVVGVAHASSTTIFELTGPDGETSFDLPTMPSVDGYQSGYDFA